MNINVYHDPIHSVSRSWRSDDSGKFGTTDEAIAMTSVQWLCYGYAMVMLFLESDDSDVWFSFTPELIAGIGWKKNTS